MSCDKLVYDLSQEVEGSPNVFVRKDWINILDNQNQNYQNNQSVIDTSQLSNSNKYMGYREAYLAVPLLLSLRTPNATADDYDINDFGIGLKNWFGTIIHSLTLEYNGTTIIQQTPFINMWNSFKLLTTLSYQDVLTQGPTIGFYPDDAGAWYYNTAGVFVANNDLGQIISSTSSTSVNRYNQSYDVDGIIAGGNQGATIRNKWICFNTNSGIVGGTGASYGQIGVNRTNINQIWKSNISNDAAATTTTNGILQISVMATIYLKHVHSFFNYCPLLKGVFMKMTLNLNNASATVTTNAGKNQSGYTSNVYVGGVQPILIPSKATGSSYQGSATCPASSTFYYDLVVGSTTYNNQITNATNSPPIGTGNLSKSIYLYVPAYTFNPTFEQAYLSNNIKQIKYTDVYQYQVKDIAAGQQFSNLVTNGIANIKSVLIIPFFSKKATAIVGGVPTLGDTYAEWQSPFDPAGTGPTAPMVSLGNFNIQISGQNAIYNSQRYTFEEWNNQLYGQNAVNGGLTDGLTSGLLNFMDFQNSYCYHYVNVERMLPVEQSVPKSVQIIGTNYSTMPLDLWIFVEYGVQVNIDVLTGARV